MERIARLALLALRNVCPSCELSSDIVLFLMTAVVGWVKVFRILNTGDCSEYKEDKLYDLFHEIEHISISSLVDEFLSEGSNDNV